MKHEPILLLIISVLVRRRSVLFYFCLARSQSFVRKPIFEPVSHSFISLRKLLRIYWSYLYLSNEGKRIFKIPSHSSCISQTLTHSADRHPYSPHTYQRFSLLFLPPPRPTKKNVKEPDRGSEILTPGSGFPTLLIPYFFPSLTRVLFFHPRKLE